MIVYVVTTEHSYTMQTYVTAWGARPGSRMRFLFYEDLPRLTELPAATYFFTDLERLTPAQIEIATSVSRQVARHAPDARVVNDPARVLCRYELLTALRRLGRNGYAVARAADAAAAALRFPVFLRSEQDHTGSLTPLLHGRRELRRAARWLRFRGHPLRDLLVVEYCHTADTSGLFRKYAAFVVGHQVLPRHMLFSRNWLLKRPDIVDADTTRELEMYLETNPHEEWIRETCALAHVAYGRIDYSLLGDEPQVWEINTNPTVRKLADLLTAAFEALDDVADGRPPIPIVVDPLLAGRAEHERRARRRTEAVRRTIDGWSAGKAAWPLRTLAGVLGLPKDARFR